LIGEGEVGGGSHVAAGKSAVLVVGVVGAGGGEFVAGADAGGVAEAVLLSGEGGKKAKAAVDVK